MKSIRVQNLRSLTDTDNMPIKAINMLVGGNSSGKSTYLRLFPLIKQSLGKKINGPILWAGDDDDYVDFGSFREAINNKCESNKIKFGFNFDLTFTKDYEIAIRVPTAELNEAYPVEIIFSLQKFSDSESYLDYVSDVTIKIFGYTIFLEFNESDLYQVTINDIKNTISQIDLEKSQYFLFEQQLFGIPLLGLQESAIQKLVDLGVIPESKSTHSDYNISGLINTLFFERIIKSNSHMYSDTDSIVKLLKKLKTKKIDDSIINNIILMYKIPYIYNSISKYLTAYFRNVYYIAPIRATAERYYRLRNAAVNEVDCRGKNLAVFLHSLKKDQLKSFQDWTLENLGFLVEKSISEGHVSLRVKKSINGQSVNLSDTGFGYSQILPIVTQLWYITLKANRMSYYRYKLPITIAIEQPELHLHPYLQAKLVDVIVKVMNEKKNIQFIIETHSETIINRLGTLIYKNKIDSSQIGINIFDKELGEDNTTIRFGKYDEEGYLEDWPIGFFEPGEV